ncbi:MAG: aminotransferase class V-fold PLP-dependent enzyme [Clostridiales bacterium]|nr:aminotransferase class V-fold PLP-dependent enzyme [Clostridiales bacterium]
MHGRSVGAMIYLDNAATSYPKPPQVRRAVSGVIDRIGGNPGRGGHAGALAGGRIMENCRSRLAGLLGAKDSSRVIFTMGCTDALNTAIRGFLHRGDEVLISPFEHNAVMRPLTMLEKTGQISIRTLPADVNGRIDPASVAKSLCSKTALCVLCHASNVTGVIQPAREIARQLMQYGIPMLLDAAQTAGVEDLSDTGAAMIALPGHKGLLGPMGVGALYVHPDITLRPLRTGGTGSVSESMEQPDMMPDLLESGTPPLPAIAGLLQGTRFALAHMGAIAQYEQALLREMYEGLARIPGVTLYGPPLSTPRTAVCAFNIGDLESGAAADLLSASGFALRGGLHCAPSTHRQMGTLDRGALRASPGPFSTEEEIDQFLRKVHTLCTK